MKVKLVFPFSHRSTSFSTNTTKQYIAWTHPYDLQFINSSQKPTSALESLRSLSLPPPGHHVTKVNYIKGMRVVL